MIAEARSTSRAALGELRSVVRGIHPPVLADRGLGGAVEALALDMAVPVRSRSASPAGRRRRSSPRSTSRSPSAWPTSASTPAPGSAWIALGHQSTACCAATVGDDGRGGADPATGTGMRGVMRRLSAFDGTMRVSSPSGGPTDRHPGGAVRLVLAEDHALLRAGLTQLLELSGLHHPRRGRQRRRPRARPAGPRRRGRGARRSPAADPHRRGAARRDRGARRAAGVPGDGALPVRRAPLRPRAAGQRRGGGRLPAQGPRLRRRGVRRRRTPGGRGRHGARPRGGRRDHGPAPRRSPSTG